jgi:hypothetical protein
MPQPQYLVRIMGESDDDIVRLKSTQERLRFIAYMQQRYPNLMIAAIKREALYKLGITCFSPSLPSKYGFYTSFFRRLKSSRELDVANTRVKIGVTTENGT